MKIIITLPARLADHVTTRLQRIPPETCDVILIQTDSAESLPPMQKNDGLILLQPESISLAQQTATSAQQSGVHFAEAALMESPLAGRYGFMVGVGGQAADLHALAPVLNALSPCPYGWWHVGEAGAAAFLMQMLKQLGGAMHHPIDVSNPLPQLAQLATLHQESAIIAGQYLESSRGERFIAAMPDRQRALAHFLNASDSPARQIAQMIKLFAKQ